MDSELRLSSPRLGSSIPINDQSNLQLGQFDPESQTFGSFRPPTEAESQLQNATHAFIRPPRQGEPATNFIATSQSTQHQSHQVHPSNGLASHLQPQGQPSSGIHQSQGYNDGIAHAANMSGALHGAAAGQMAPPASLSQNELAMGNNAHQANNSLTTLQSSSQPFQPDFIGLDPGPTDPVAFTGPGELQGFKLVPNPPHLDYWRERLFNVDEMITLSEEEYADSIVGIISTLLGG
jgi:glutathione S-transferase